MSPRSLSDGEYRTLFHPDGRRSRIPSCGRPRAVRGGRPMKRTCRILAGLIVMLGVALPLRVEAEDTGGREREARHEAASEVLDWNQTFVEMLITTNAVNASSPRLGAIVHTAIFDAYNGIDRRYTPVFVRDRAPRGASRRAAAVAAAYTALSAL